MITLPAMHTLISDIRSLATTFIIAVTAGQFCQYFGLPAVDMAELARVIGKSPVGGAHSRVWYPRFRVLPMGFSWASYLAQEALRCCTMRALPTVQFVEDHQPSPTWVMADLL